MGRAGKISFFILFLMLFCECQTIPKNFVVIPTYAASAADTANTKLGVRLKPLLEAHPGLAGIYPLADGPDALVARLASAHAAEKTLDIQYYIWNDDMTGRLMMEALLEAADRGVRVRLLLDDLNIGPHEDPLLVLDSHPNIEVRMFNPFANRTVRFFELSRFDQANHRMHNKSFVADNQVAIVGGRNIGNEYFMAGSELNFGDYDVWMAGPLVNDVSKTFDLYWNHNLAVPVSVLHKREIKADELEKIRVYFKNFHDEVRGTPYAFALKESDLRKSFHDGTMKLFWAKARLVADSPGKLNGDQDADAHKMILTQNRLSERAEKEMFFVSPYFIPGQEGIDFFKAQIAHGVKIKVLTNSLASNDVASVFAGYRKYRKELLKSGVELYELKPKAVLFKKHKGIGSSGALSGLHAKVYVFDRQRMFIGSMNLDPRSLDLNSEMGVVVNSAEMANSFVEPLLKNMPEAAYKVSFRDDRQDDLQWVTQEDGKTVSLNSEPEASTWKKAKALFYSLFMPESML